MAAWNMPCSSSAEGAGAVSLGDEFRFCKKLRTSVMGSTGNTGSAMITVNMANAWPTGSGSTAYKNIHEAHITGHRLHVITPLGQLPHIAIYQAMLYVIDNPQG
jgi:hypothetical protein